MKRGQTLAEKILSNHTKKPVQAGEIAIVDVDKVLFQDWTGPLAIKQIEAIGFKKLKLAKNTYFFVDHSAPSSRIEISTDQAKLRNFAKKHGCVFHDIDQGVCHQIMTERYVNPGEVVVGADSHTCLPGSLGAFSTGMGSTDVAIASALAKTWMRIPEAYKVELDGKLSKGVFSKDVILHLIGFIGADGATYKSLEYSGSYVKRGPFENRMVLSNMAVEAGAKAGIFPSDKHTKEWMKKNARAKDWKPVEADDHAEYEKEVRMNVHDLEPTVSFPHTIDNSRPISHKDCKNVKIQQVLIGSCANADFQDYEIAARILKGRHIDPSVRLVVTPPSIRIVNKMLESKVYKTLLDAGATITSPGCGACPGSQTGLLGDGESCIASTNRNFQGRLGNPKSFVYLGSAATCAASALSGRITDPREAVR